QAEKDLRGAVDYLATQSSSQKVGAVGFCMGGQLALFAGTVNPKVGAVVDFYGIHPNVKPDYGKLGGPVLGLFAEKDQFVKPDDDSVAVMRDGRQPGAAPGRFAIERRLRAVGHDLRGLGLAVVAPHGQRAQADVVARAAFLRTLPLFAAFSLAELIELADHID